ncbi:MAG: hypothetical protein EBR94_06405 [Bacteroidetes bacterium]|jgi:hypothetical protein|nr:hypothetical protein [Bacteroidota bacterium]
MKHEITNVLFYIQQIKTDQFAIIAEHFSPTAGVELLSKIEFKLDLQQQRIGTFMSFEFHQSQKVFIKIACSCHFQIEPASWEQFPRTNSSITIPKPFLLHIATITTGTARGVLSSKTEGTTFGTFIIPTVDLTKMVLSDAEFALT